MRKLHTHEELLALIKYDDETGIFTRLRSGKCAAPTVIAHGYIRITVGYGSYLAHRLAWFYMTGQWPEKEIDHVNGDRADNRFSNLRNADRTLNTQNLRRASRNNKSTGLLGAHKSRDKFVAHIQVDKRQIHLGVFETAQMAHEAYLSAKRTMHKGCTI